GVGPTRGRRLACDPFVLTPADGDLGVPWVPVPAGTVERLDQLPIRRQADQPVPDLAGHLGGALSTGGDQDGRWFLRRRVQPGAIDAEVIAVMVDPFARPQASDHLHRLPQHRASCRYPRPRIAEDVLVEVLPRAKAEREPAGCQS